MEETKGDISGLGKSNIPNINPIIIEITASLPLNLELYKPKNTGNKIAQHTMSAIKNK